MPDVEGENQTTITEFILLGFGDLHELKIPVFMVFLAIYIVTLTGNILIIVTVSYNQNLHKPMYFFLGNVSVLEVCYTTSITPKMLKTLLVVQEDISFSSCLLQFYIFGSLVVAECFLLAAMSYDRYLAICKPLHYASTMSFQLCFQLAVGSWAIGFLSLVVTMPMVSWLPFCASKEIDHFFCDLTPIIKLSCGDTYMVRIPAFIIASLVSFLPFLLTLLSYYKIISTILKIPSTSGKQKDFSTCSSHLIVVPVFYGTLMVVYAAPIANQWPNLNKTFSVLYTVVTPLINPIVYSLRNTEVKETLRKLFSKNPC
ncbi:olfactory receptor 6B1-like [Gopherus evgoodei]|uniref:olfactory receptor 6B1-like n=1 Tax=Gopherus evgoodei TaxID=1825980 RepID=UPI0011CFE334|nr:olfactory receptor 6B1-like [Gopherus evgoodei]